VSVKNKPAAIDSEIASNKPNTLPLLFTCFFLYLPFLFDYGMSYLHIQNVDFPSFYWGAKVVFDSGVSPYGPGVFNNAELLLKQEVFPYLYPPPSLLLFYPFTLTDYETARVIMLGINHLLLIFFAYLFLIKILELDLKTLPGMAIFFFWFLYLLLFYPVVLTLNHGQINLVVLSLLCLSWYALKNQASEAYVAIPLAVAILLKTYPLLFLPLLLFKKKNRALGWTIGLVAAISVSAYAILPQAVWRDWIADVLPSGGYGGIPSGLSLSSTAYNQSINGFALRLFFDNESEYLPLPGKLLEKWLPYTLSAVIAGTTLLLSYLTARTRRANDSLDLEFSITLLMMFLISPLSWEHHLVFVLPAVIIIMYRLLKAGRIYVLSIFTVPAAILLAWDTPAAFPSLGEGLLAILARSLKFYGVVVFWLLAAVMLYGVRPARVIGKSEPILQTGARIES